MKTSFERVRKIRVNIEVKPCEILKILPTPILSPRPSISAIFGVSAVKSAVKTMVIEKPIECATEYFPSADSPRMRDIIIFSPPAITDKEI